MPGAMYPGSTMTTRIPKWPSSKCSVSDSASSACFDAAYAPSSGVPILPWTELMLTSTPLPRSRQAGTTAWAMRSGPRVFTSSTWANDSSG